MWHQSRDDCTGAWHKPFSSGNVGDQRGLSTRQNIGTISRSAPLHHRRALRSEQGQRVKRPRWAAGQERGWHRLDESKIVETLEKQLQLLSERSSEPVYVSTAELVELTKAMNETAGYLLSRLSRVV